MMAIALCVGEPAGIGPELVVKAAQRPWTRPLVALGDPDLLLQTAERLQMPLQLLEENAQQSLEAPGTLRLRSIRLPRPAVAGTLDPQNSAAMVACIDGASEGCLNGRYAAMVTAPVHKAAINQGGIPFSGHTERIAELAGVARVVMLLVAGSLRVALATTHLPLRAVADAIEAEGLTQRLRILHQGLQRWFDLPAPRIAVLGLNPHAGEDGLLGREEIEVIGPVINALKEEGLILSGPWPADTAFVAERLQQFDAVMAMYHDQGLPVLKHAGFGHAVNVTLGLPFLRTSVDHGTALDLAGRGVANPGSLYAAIELAIAGCSGQPIVASGETTDV